MILRYGVLYLSTLVSMVVLDGLFLILIAAPLFKATLGDLLLPSFRVTPAVLFYLLYTVGLLTFVSLPSAAAGAQAVNWPGLIWRGMLFGLIAYATYDLTNSATLKVWTLRLVLTDLVWGTLGSAAAASIGTIAGRAIIGLLRA